MSFGTFEEDVRREPEPELEGLRPARIVRLDDERSGLRAVVVIDRIRSGPSGGGVRMAPDLDLREIARLARAMTLKYALLGMPIGGAKAGIWLDPASPDRSRVMRAFVDAVRPLVAEGAFVPGADMGTSVADFVELGGSTAALEDYEGLPLEEQLTGFGVIVAARTALASLGRSLRGATVAIEGFGKVGAGAARALEREGARLVAVSTIRAAIHDPNGLDTEKLIALRAEGGDAALERMPGARVLPREALFEVPCDVLIPGARTGVIDAERARTLRATLIVPASNAPYATGAVDILERRNVIAFPDFVSNAGGVLGAVAAVAGFGAKSAFEMVDATIASVTTRVMERARSDGGGPHAAAIRMAEEALETEATQ